MWGISDRADNRKSNIVGGYVIGQTAETLILWGISDRADSRNSNIVGLYLIGQIAETVILWEYI